MMRLISYEDAVNFLLPKHYSGRTPQISKAFGWFVYGELVAVCTFGKPASASLCKGVMGGQYSSNVYELNRLCRVDNFSQPLSKFVAFCLREIARQNDWIVVSYADTAMNHNGYIYQACNFIYTGATERRTDKYTEGNKHSRPYDKNSNVTKRKVRSSKHRYIYFATNRKVLKQEWFDLLAYRQEPYPKGLNKTYQLGTILKPEIIE